MGLLQIRAALLEEIQLAAQVLSEGNHFSLGVAAAISSHIRCYLGEGEGFAEPALLDHARLLDVEPLKALLDFLWLQLGLKWDCLPQCINASVLMGVRTPSWQAWSGALKGMAPRQPFTLGTRSCCTFPVRTTLPVIQATHVTDVTRAWRIVTCLTQRCRPSAECSNAVLCHAAHEQAGNLRSPT